MHALGIVVRACVQIGMLSLSVLQECSVDKRLVYQSTVLIFTLAKVSVIVLQCTVVLFLSRCISRMNSIIIIAEY